jgi:regulatory protein YycI of two-component signal transduction system YycFG
MIKIDIDNLNEKLKNSGLNCYLKDFQINTEMPVSYSNYEVSPVNKDAKNVDYKKQQINFNFTVHDGSDKEIFFNMNKGQLLNFYEEIEKIQEKLDKLY